jgi:hypothetical protein
MAATKVKSSQVFTTWLPTFTQELAVRSTVDPTGRTWSLSKTPKFAIIHRNGIAMAAGEDYTLTGNLITFTEAQGSDPDDLNLVFMIT